MMLLVNKCIRAQLKVLVYRLEEHDRGKQAPWATRTNLPLQKAWKNVLIKVSVSHTDCGFLLHFTIE
jgi:hypothetical protein